MKSPLSKRYDKLTARERFAALMAADIRDDKTEMHALISSAPRKTFSFPHTRGLTDGFEFLSAWHMIKQLGNSAIFFCLMAIPEYHEKLKVLKIDEVTYNLDDISLLICRRVLEQCKAWRAVCEENGLDPVGLLRNYPAVEMIEMMELIMDKAAVLYGEDLELTDYEKTLETYRQAIEQHAEGWE